MCVAAQGVNVRAIFEGNVTGRWLSSTVTTPLLFPTIPVPPVISYSSPRSLLIVKSINTNTNKLYSGRYGFWRTSANLNILIHLIDSYRL